MYQLIKPLLFALEPERSHDLSLNVLSWASHNKLALKTIQTIWGDKVSHKPIKLMGLDLSNPVGLAAGLDKQGTAGNAFAAMGFAWVEFGTVTPLPQAGNEKPRMFRLQAAEAIINRMGFNSIGLQAFMQNIQRQSPTLVKGLNIGKNANTAIENAIDDYLIALQEVYPVADYICLNISSPNTKNLRSLQDADSVEALIKAVTNKREQLADQHGVKKPLVLKVAPDLNQADLDSISKVLIKYQIDGLAATNTTLSRHGVENLTDGQQAGGLSGKPVTQRSTDIIAGFYQRLQGEVAIIGIGGIHDASSAKEKFQAGADAIQLFTGFVYHGPKLIREIVDAI